MKNEIITKTTSAEQHLAIEMIPPLDYDPPLSFEELRPKFGYPVERDGVNYSLYLARYMRDVIGETPEFEPEPKQLPLRSLAQIDSDELRFAMEGNQFLLLAHDKQQHRAEGYTSFQKWVHEAHGKRWSRSTIHRRVFYAKLALILAANGMIDSLPSQANAYRIASYLPRPHWIDFLKTNQVAGAGDTKIKKMILEFAERHRIPLRSTPVIDHMEKEALELPAVESPVEGQLIEAQENKKDNAHEANLLLVNALAEKIKDWLPAQTIKRLGQSQMGLSKKTLSIIAKQLKAENKSSRSDRRRHLHDWLQVQHPDLADRIRQAALNRFYHKVEKEIGEIVPRVEHQKKRMPSKETQGQSMLNP